MSRLVVPAAWVLLFALPALGPRLSAQGKAQSAESRDVVAFRALRTRTKISVEIMPLADFVTYLSTKHKIRCRLDRAGLARARVDPSTPISADIEGVPLSQALREILGRLNLAHRVVNGVVVIADSPPAEAELAQLNAQRQNVAQQFVLVQNRAQRVQLARQALGPPLQVELIFVKRTCGLSKEQLRPLKKEFAQFIEDAPNMSTFAAKVLREKMAASIEAHLNREQAAVYHDEVEKRFANERAVCARSLVAFLDCELGLSAGQRAALVTALSGRWDDAWTPIVEMESLQGAKFVPSIPQDLIEPVLDAAQLSVWRSMQKISNVNWPPQTLIRIGLLGVPLADPEED